MEVNLTPFPTFGLEENYRRRVQAGQLVPTLPDYPPSLAGFLRYFPSRHNQPRKLRALVEHVRGFRGRGSDGSCGNGHRFEGKPETATPVRLPRSSSTRRLPPCRPPALPDTDEQ